MNETITILIGGLIFVNVALTIALANITMAMRDMGRIAEDNHKRHMDFLERQIEYSKTREAEMRAFAEELAKEKVNQ